MTDNTPKIEEEEPSNTLRGDVMNLGGVAEHLGFALCLERELFF